MPSELAFCGMTDWVMYAVVAPGGTRRLMTSAPALAGVRVMEGGNVGQPVLWQQQSPM